MNDEFSKLEKSILISKGLDEASFSALYEAGVCCKDDFNTIGDPQTLTDISGLNIESSTKIMEWAIGFVAKIQNISEESAGATLSHLVVESPDTVFCVHCKAKQPKDYQPGDLCLSCGKQAEPTCTCYWCGKIGPGKFCRTCGSEFVPVHELDLAVLLRREGTPKDEIPSKLINMDPSEKNTLWQRLRGR